VSAAERLAEIGIVPVVEIDDAAKAPELGQVLSAAGLDAVELTFRTPAAGEAIQRLRESAPRMILLAGTVTRESQVEEAKAAGADLLVAPGLKPRVVEKAQSLDLQMLPGISTPSEIEQATDLGLSALKVFPAELLGGTSFLRALSGPYRELRWNPSGGISIGNLASYLELDSVLACSGTWIATRSDLAAGNFDAIQKRAEEAVAVVRSVRQRAVAG
jgi:2-dehydro-3-deoxyphosphogluconate aldolase/(4S)-4-hydroxy-2-oxoglutarate aldolase